MTNSITIFEKHGLINSNVSYSEVANAFLSTGYTSQAGNTYFNSIRVAEGILIKEDVGVGYARTFLNGIKIYSIKDKTLLADKSFNSLFYSKQSVKGQAKRMLIEVLKEASLSQGLYFDENKASSIIDRVLDQAINEDQREMLLSQTKKLLAG